MPRGRYDYTPLALFDEEECANARVRHHFELLQEELHAQLPLATGQTLAVPIRVGAVGDAECTCEVKLEYTADAPISDAPAPDAVAAGYVSQGGRWSRRLTLPVVVPTAVGLAVGGADVVVCPDPHRLYVGNGGAAALPPSAAATLPPGCLLTVPVRNTHERATFELCCELGAAVNAPSAPAGRELRWTIPPSSSRRILLSICTLDTSVAHPLPDSLAMLESYLAQRKPPPSADEAVTIRRAHLLKALLLSSVRMHWRRLGGGEESGMLPLASLTFDEPQLEALCRPPLILHAELHPHGPATQTDEDAWRAALPGAHALRVRVANASSKPLTGAVLRIRAELQGGAAALHRAAPTARAAAAPSPRRMHSTGSPHSLGSSDGRGRPTPTPPPIEGATGSVTFDSEPGGFPRTSADGSDDARRSRVDSQASLGDSREEEFQRMPRSGSVGSMTDEQLVETLQPTDGVASLGAPPPSSERPTSPAVGARALSPAGAAAAAAFEHLSRKSSEESVESPLSRGVGRQLSHESQGSYGDPSSGGALAPADEPNWRNGASGRLSACSGRLSQSQSMRQEADEPLSPLYLDLVSPGVHTPSPLSTNQDADKSAPACPAASDKGSSSASTMPACHSSGTLPTGSGTCSYLSSGGVGGDAYAWPPAVASSMWESVGDGGRRHAMSSLHWVMSEPDADSEIGHDGCLDADEMNAAHPPPWDDPAVHEPLHLLAADGLWWGGAVDTVLPVLEIGATHEHEVHVGWYETPGTPYRITAECVGGEGMGDVVCTTFVDLLPR